ncbi:LacI family DNA-binding transcriptional regulator [Nocardioides maradonensis]
MAVTVIEVARVAGVSKSTAARALSDSPGVSPAARKRVIAAAESLGYRVNRMASALRAGESRLIGLVVTNLVNASIHTITEVVQSRAQEAGYQVLLGVTGGDPDREAHLIDTLIDHRVDGLIIMGTGANTDRINSLAQAGLPVVSLIRRAKNGLTPAVLPDNYHGAYEATQYLLGLGHRQIAFLGGDLGVTSGHERFAGYRSALEQAGDEVNDLLVHRGPFDVAFGSSAMTQLLDGPASFTALLVGNHEATYGVLSTLAARGVRVPEDLSVIAFEDFHWFATWTPPITVVDIDSGAIANATFDSLIAQIKGGTAASTGVARTGAHLVVRESCGPVSLI